MINRVVLGARQLTRLSSPFSFKANLEKLLSEVSALQADLMKEVPKQLQLQDSLKVLKQTNWAINTNDRVPGLLRLDKTVENEQVTVYVKPTPFFDEQPEEEESKEAKEEREYMMQSVNYYLVVPNGGRQLVFQFTYNNYNQSDTLVLVSASSTKNFKSYYEKSDSEYAPVLQNLAEDEKIIQTVLEMNDEILKDIQPQLLFLAKGLQLEQFDIWAKKLTTGEESPSSSLFKP